MLKYAISLHDQGNAPASVPYYQKAIELDPGNLAAYNNLGVAMQELGQYEVALACFRKALEIDGLHAAALQNLAALTVRQGRVKLAIECLRRALLLDPNDETAQALLVKVMQFMNNRRTRPYPLLPGGVMDTDVVESNQDVAASEDEKEKEVETSRGQWRAEDEEGSTDEAQRYLTWEEILQNAWKAKEEMMRKKQQEEEERYRAEEERRAKEQEEARERARQVEERIQELFYGRPPSTRPVAAEPSAARQPSQSRREIPIRTPGEDRIPINQEVTNARERPMAAGVRPNVAYQYPRVAENEEEVVNEGPRLRNGGMGPPQPRNSYFQDHPSSTWDETIRPSTREDVPARRGPGPQGLSLEEALGRSSPRGSVVPQEDVEEEQEEDEDAFSVDRSVSGVTRTRPEEGQVTDDLMRDRLKASYDTWSQLRNAAWADQAKKEEALAELKRGLQRQQEVSIHSMQPLSAGL